MRETNTFNQQEWHDLQELICKKSGFRLNKDLLTQALIRRSYSARYGGENCEILEFIGDRVLDYYVVKRIAERFGALNDDGAFSFGEKEDRLHSVKAEIVSNRNLAAIIDDWGIARYLVVGKCDLANRIDEEEKVKADLFESLLGAIAIQSEFDTAVLETAVSGMLGIDALLVGFVQKEAAPAECSPENAVTVLKELGERGTCAIPDYQFQGPEVLGYDENGVPLWMCTCTVVNRNHEIVRSVWATSKKIAKKAAAYLVLCEYFGLQNEYGTNEKRIAWEYKDGKLFPKNP